MDYYCRPPLSCWIVYWTRSILLLYEWKSSWLHLTFEAARARIRRVWNESSSISRPLGSWKKRRLFFGSSLLNNEKAQHKENHIVPPWSTRLHMILVYSPYLKGGLRLRMMALIGIPLQHVIFPSVSRPLFLSLLPRSPFSTQYIPLLMIAWSKVTEYPTLYDAVLTPETLTTLWWPYQEIASNDESGGI